MINYIESTNQNNLQIKISQDNHQLNINEDHDRLFSYKLDEKTIRNKLLKGAKRIPFDIVEKTLCSIIMFSDGAFQNIVKPLLNTLSKHHK